MQLIEVSQDIWVNPAEVAIVERQFDTDAYDEHRLGVRNYSNSKRVLAEVENMPASKRAVYERVIENTPEEHKTEPVKDDYYVAYVFMVGGQYRKVKKNYLEIIDAVNGQVSTEGENETPTA